MTTPNENNTTELNGATNTGRDGYITLKALIYAIAHIQTLPDERQECSDMMDMCELVYAGPHSWATIDHVVCDVEHHIQREIDLFPGDGGDQDRHEMRARLNAMKSAIKDQLGRFNDGGAA